MSTRRNRAFEQIVTQLRSEPVTGLVSDVSHTPPRFTLVTETGTIQGVHLEEVQQLFVMGHLSDAMAHCLTKHDLIPSTFFPG